jgi:hypothetical protein
MNVFTRLRFRARPPSPGLPPKDRIDVYHDYDTGKMVARNNVGAAIKFDADGGTTSTDDIGVSNGSSAAAAGALGEYLEDSKSSGTALTLTGADTVLQLSLTPGDWDVQAFLRLQLNAASVGYVVSKIQQNEGVIVLGTDAFREDYNTTTESIYRCQTHVPRRIRVSTTTPIYLAVVATITAGTVSATGFLSARRAR